MASFSDNFNTDPASRWTNAWNAFAWSSNQFLSGASGGSYSLYNTSTESADQYARATITTGGSGFLFRAASADGTGGFYVVIVGPSNIYLSLGGTSGWIADIVSTAYDVGSGAVGVTLTGTSTSTTVRVWIGVTATAPDSATSWDSQAADATLTHDGSPATYHDTGTYIGLGLDASSIAFDDFYGGSIGGAALDLSVADTSVVTVAI